MQGQKEKNQKAHDRNVSTSYSQKSVEWRWASWAAVVLCRELRADGCFPLLRKHNGIDMWGPQLRPRPISLQKAYTHVFSSHRGPSQCSYCGLMKHHLLPSQLGLRPSLSWGCTSEALCSAETHQDDKHVWLSPTPPLGPMISSENPEGIPKDHLVLKQRIFPVVFTSRVHHDWHSHHISKLGYIKENPHFIHIQLPTVLTQWTLDKEVLSGQLVRQQVWNHS